MRASTLTVSKKDPVAVVAGGAWALMPELGPRVSAYGLLEDPSSKGFPSKRLMASRTSSPPGRVMCSAPCPFLLPLGTTVSLPFLAHGAHGQVLPTPGHSALV